MRIFAVSDIHIDYQENLHWLLQLSKYDYRDDCLILAGDVSDKFDKLEQAFEHLSKIFAEVFYVPGNHELWVENGSQEHSHSKFFRILELAKQYNINIQPKSFGNLRIVPLFSWYDLSFGELTEKLQQSWVDFRRCRWPQELNNANAQNLFFLKQNLPNLNSVKEQTLSFSHFLPRIDVMPTFIPERFRFVYPALGSRKLDEHVRKTGASIHVYGHSHVNRDITIEGVRYINNAFAYPSETRISAKSLCLVVEI